MRLARNVMQASGIRRGAAIAADGNGREMGNKERFIGMSETQPRVRRGKGSGGLNRSEEVRKYLLAHPAAGPKEVVAVMAQQGITITSALVSNVKYGSGRSKKANHRARAAAAPPVEAGSDIPLDLLIEAKKFADRMGGIAQARAALDALASLQMAPG